MTLQEACEEIAYINCLPIEEVRRQYKVDTRQEIIDLINEEIEEEVEAVGDIYQENGFPSAYHCNAHLY